jgi:flagellar protein FlbD
MIKLVKLNGAMIVVNAEIIESVESTPDTVINLATGNRFVVRDPLDEVIAKIIDYRKQVYAGRLCVNPTEGFERHEKKPFGEHTPPGY